jgi:hypothetical protein
MVLDQNLNNNPLAGEAKGMENMGCVQHSDLLSHKNIP